MNTEHDQYGKIIATHPSRQVQKAWEIYNSKDGKVLTTPFSNLCGSYCSFCRTYCGNYRATTEAVFCTNLALHRYRELSRHFAPLICSPFYKWICCGINPELVSGLLSLIFYLIQLIHSWIIIKLLMDKCRLNGRSDRWIDIIDTHKNPNTSVVSILYLQLAWPVALSSLYIF